MSEQSRLQDDIAGHFVADPPPPIWHGVVAYAGTAYHGWQIQPAAPTVQGEITRRLRRLYNHDELRIAGTSRTDAGVHALDQHFSFVDPAPGRFAPERLAEQLRRWLPHGIQLRHLNLAPADFHARHSACAKAYTYAVCRSQAPTPFEAPFVWHWPRPANLATLREAAARLVGRRDFTSLAAQSKPAVEDPIKHLYRLDVIERDEHLYFNLVGDSFLYKMVRGIVGYLLLNAADADAWTAVKQDAMLAARRRDPTVQTAPPQGLFLAKVFFAENDWQTYQPHLPPQA